MDEMHGANTSAIEVTNVSSQRAYPLARLRCRFINGNYSEP